MTLEELVRERMDDLDISEMVESEIRKLIAQEATKSIHAIMEKKIDKILTDAIAAEMDRPVVTNDGWGKVEKFTNFEACFRQTFAKKLAETWQVHQVIQKQVDTRIDELMKTRNMGES